MQVARRRRLPGAGRRAVGARDRRAARARPDRRRHGPPAGGQPHLLGGQPRPHHAAQDGRPTAERRCCTGSRTAVHGPGRRDRGPHPALRRARRRSPARAGTARRTSRCRSPRTSSSRPRSAIQEQGEDFPAVLVEPQSVRAYPSPYGINAAHLLGYLSPITVRRARRGQGRATTRPCTAPRSSAAPGSRRQYDRYLRGMPGYKRVAVDSMGRVLGDSGEVDGRAGDTLVTSIDARVQAVVEQQLAQTIRTARQTFDKVTAPQLRRRLRRRRRAGRQERPRRRDGRPPTYDPKVWVGGITLQAARAALLRQGALPAAVPRDPGAVRARARRGSRS